jgi:hypothetical protein
MSATKFSLGKAARALLSLRWTPTNTLANIRANNGRTLKLASWSTLANSGLCITPNLTKTYYCLNARRPFHRDAPNKSLDRSGGSASRIKRDPAQVAR